MKKFIICLLLVLICSVSFASGDGGNGPTPKVTVGSGGIIDGSVITPKLADGAVTNDKVATGTFAELNGQATEDFAAKELSAVGSFTVTSGLSISSRLVSVYNGGLADGGVIDTGWVDAVNKSVIAFTLIDLGVPRYDEFTWAFSSLSGTEAWVSGTKDNATTINIYLEGGTWQIQNKTGGVVAVMLQADRLGL